MSFAARSASSQKKIVQCNRKRLGYLSGWSDVFQDQLIWATRRFAFGTMIEVHGKTIILPFLADAPGEVLYGATR